LKSKAVSFIGCFQVGFREEEEEEEEHRGVILIWAFRLAPTAQQRRLPKIFFKHLYIEDQLHWASSLLPLIVTEVLVENNDNVASVGAPQHFKVK
jgi:hypothetical protein